MSFLNLILISTLPLLSINFQVYTEKFTANPQTNKATLEFSIPSKLLPQALQDTLLQSNVSQVTIMYGSIPFFEIHQHFKTEQRNQIFVLINKTLHNEIHEHLLKLIEGTFSISLSSRYSLYLSEINLLAFHDPNHKFCIQHIEQIVRNLLPCSFHSGISQILDVNTFFSSHRMYGMRVNWNKNFMKVAIETEIRKNQGFKRLKVNRKCLKQSTLEMSDFSQREIRLNQVVLDRLLEFQAPQKIHTQLKSPQILKQINGNWYSPYKNIKVSFKISQFPLNSTIIYHELLPERATIANVNVIGNFELKSNHWCTEKLNSKQVKYKEKSRACQVHIKNIQNNKNSGTNIYEFQIEIEIYGKLISFDLYEASFGGGTQIPSFPITLNSIQSQQNSEVLGIPRSITFRAPQPDEALPFQVITFVLGVFGYLWLTVWRKFSNDFSKDLQVNPQVDSQDQNLVHENDH